MEIPIDCEAN